MVVLSMSHGELSRFDTLMRVERGELRIEDAAALLALKRRQVFRSLERLRAEGASGLISRKRGRPSNRRHSDVFRKQVVALIREHYGHVTVLRRSLVSLCHLGFECERADAAQI
jgi:predicted ArsR family transcriptional regulator